MSSCQTVNLSLKDYFKVLFKQFQLYLHSFPHAKVSILTCFLLLLPETSRGNKCNKGQTHFCSQGVLWFGGGGLCHQRMRDGSTWLFHHSCQFFFFFFSESCSSTSLFAHKCCFLFRLQMSFSFRGTASVNSTLLFYSLLKKSNLNTTKCNGCGLKRLGVTTSVWDTKNSAWCHMELLQDQWVQMSRSFWRHEYKLNTLWLSNSCPSYPVSPQLQKSFMLVFDVNVCRRVRAMYVCEQ